MLNRWFFAPRTPSDSNGGDRQDDAPAREADFIVLPSAASDSWRTWLMTGLRKPPFDRRRIRGANQGLKKMLIEGTTTGDSGPQPWNDFSSAMVRQSVDEALNSLPAGHKQVVKLAYFGGMTNPQIARHVGVGEAAVRRWLRDALARVSAHVEMGRAVAQRTLYAIAAWFAMRSIANSVRRTSETASGHVAQAAVVVVCGVLTASVIAGQAPSPAQLTQVDHGRTAAAVRAPAVLPAASLPAGPVTVPVTVPVSAPSLPGTASIPSIVPAPVRTPPLPRVPIKLPELPKIL